MARRRFQEGQVYEKDKNWIGRWREDIVEADGKIRRIRRPAFSAPSVNFQPNRWREGDCRVPGAENDPAYRPGRITTLVEFAERWQAEVLTHCKQSSISAAKSHLRTHILGNLLWEERHRPRTQETSRYRGRQRGARIRRR